MSPRAQGIMPILAESFVNDRSLSTSPASARLFSSSTRSSPMSTRTVSSVKVPKQSPQSASSNSSDSPADHKDILSCSDAVLASNYVFVAEIGFGNWGSVWECKKRTEPKKGLTVSTKLVHRSKSTTSSARVKSLWQEYKAIRNLRSLLHPNIIRFHSFVITPSYAIIVMDHHPRLIPISLPEQSAKPYFRQLLSAVDYLHARGVTHNDIKPSNIMLSRQDMAVLIDFGFAKLYPASATDRFLSSLSWGTPEYLDPLRAKGALHDERSSDVWALGVTLYEIVVGRTPFEEHDKEEFLTRDALEVYYKRTLSRKFFGEMRISQDFADLIRSMVEPDPRARVKGCGQALKHAFFLPEQAQRNPVPSPTRPSKSPARQKAKKQGDIKVFEDPDQDQTALKTPLKSQHTVSTGVFSPRPFILQDTNVLAHPPRDIAAKKLQLQKSTASMRGPRAPSRIPVRTTASRANSLVLDAKTAQTAIATRTKMAQMSHPDLGFQDILSSEVSEGGGSDSRTRPRLEPIVVETVFPSSAGFDDTIKSNSGRLSPAGIGAGLDDPKRQRQAPVAILGLRKIKSSIVNAAKRARHNAPVQDPHSPDLILPTAAFRLWQLESIFAGRRKRSESTVSLMHTDNAALAKSNVGAPHKVRAPSRQTSSTQLRSSKTETRGVKIRPSLAPSFAGKIDEVEPDNSAVDSDIVFEADLSAYDLEPSASFKRTHRRIPTNIRKVPPIYLTESGDDESEAGDAQVDLPSQVNGSSEISSPPPSRIVEQGRTLPTWVPKCVDSDDDEPERDADNEVDEPTLTLSTPKRKRTRAAQRISCVAVGSTSPVRPSFERMTRPSTSTSMSRPLTEYRPSSRTSTLHSRRSVLSLFTAPFAPSVRASTDTAATEDSAVSVPASQVSQVSKVKKDGKLVRAMRKIFH
ncbi:hypothetical protein OIV83_002750 [Microbotryomycetes sp. JL201]|nr:hypothetical protein OIV83_002750 [Microbotryomycetes sp. JL201]